MKSYDIITGGVYANTGVLLLRTSIRNLELISARRLTLAL